jgi:hypothetical protein
MTRRIVAASSLEALRYVDGGVSSRQMLQDVIAAVPVSKEQVCKCTPVDTHSRLPAVSPHAGQHSLMLLHHAVRAADHLSVALHKRVQSFCRRSRDFVFVVTVTV